MAKNFPKWMAVTKLQVQECSENINIKQDKYQKHTLRISLSLSPFFFFFLPRNFILVHFTGLTSTLDI